ncbi:MAG: GNAT family N-acetyltransferase [Candidatus Omnitrophota bacterium]|nr:MAG: GNAT family N-acetyltransferase [Candidatus Omnitrophota bacterium]
MNEKDMELPSAEILIADAEEERQKIYRLRYKVFVEEMRIQYGNADYRQQILKDELDEDAVHLYQKTHYGAVSAIRLNLGRDSSIPAEMQQEYALKRFRNAYPMETFSFTSKLVVAAEWRGERILSNLVCAAYEYLLDQGILFDFTRCVPSLLHLYEYLGYRRYKDNFTDFDEGYSIPLVLVMKDCAHFDKVRSPFGELCRKREPDAEAAEWFKFEFPNYVGFVNKRVMELDDYWKFLGHRLYSYVSVPLLRDLTADELKTFLTSGTVLQCNTGDTIIRQDDVGNEMYVILDGNVEVRSYLENRVVSLRTMGKGDIFGEMALFSEQKRSADVVALTNLEILVLTKSFIRQIMQEIPDIATKILYNLSLILCERLRSTTQNWISAVKEQEEEKKE